MIDLDLDDGATALGGLAPEALRAMSVDELVALAARLRGFLVDAVARTGGHLGANLGVVELTLALHRTFESPRDAIVWDTGHQAYAHKVVTGRADQFATLRQADGLSGYPNRSESAHDLVENSHASTAMSYASGIAAARRRLGTPGRVVAVVGDGSLTGGVAYEALNNLAVRRDDVLVVLNDNGRSYAPTISPLTAAGGSDHAGRRARAFFGALGIECLGPIDGHDVGALLDALAELAARPGPVVLHVLTRKGKGYGPAE
ncbi:MAG TPA: 1-deoxy-D-xylulose-5-phosphate synthase N-terminal domain-containing protein, partial [Acidimicrobiales bacterium]|nr:1-deoxy-D-xylulose-5-phosphate synthase N-terminal domain-containing protein [Acidimicrobiales bacterium]